MDANQIAEQTEDVFDVEPDLAAQQRVEEIQRQERQQQSGGQQQQQQGGQQGQQQQQSGQQQGQQQDDLPEGMHRDEISGRRYVNEAGRRVWIDPKPDQDGQGQGQQGQQQGQQGQGQGQQQQNGNGQGQGQQGQPLAVDAQALEAIVRSVVSGVGQQGQQGGQQQQQQQQLTPEQEDQLMNRWRPNDEWYTKFQNPQTMKDAIGEMRDGLIKEAATAAKYLMDMYVGELKPVIQPLSEHVNRETVKQWRNEFFTKYKSLEPYESLLDVVVKAKTADGWKPKSRDAGFQEIAADVEKVIKTQNPQFSLANPTASQQNGNGQQNGAQQQQQQQRRQPNQMSRTTSGGGQGGGSAARTTQTADKKLDGGIWD